MRDGERKKFRYAFEDVCHHRYFDGKLYASNIACITGLATKTLHGPVVQGKCQQTPTQFSNTSLHLQRDCPPSHRLDFGNMLGTHLLTSSWPPLKPISPAFLSSS